MRSAKEKRFEEIVGVIKLIKNQKKIKDISKILTSFENLTKAFVKAKNVIDKEEKGVIPRFYIRSLVELDTFVTESWDDKELRKKMTKINAKSLASLRQKLRKYNIDFETEINKYKENPDAEDAEEEEEDSDDDDDSDDGSSNDDEEVVKPKVKPDKEAEKAAKVPKSGLAGSDDDSDDSEWSSSSDSSTDESDVKHDGQKTADYFKKKVGDDGEKDEKEKEKGKGKKGKVRPVASQVVEVDDEGGEWNQVKGGVATQEKPKMFAKDEEVNIESMLTKINEVLAMRGRKRIHRSDQVEMLAELLEISTVHNLGPAMEIKIIFGIVGGLLDYNHNITTCMKPDMWVKGLELCNRLLDLLTSNLDITVGEAIAEDSESFAETPFRVSGCALTLVERIDEEFTKMLQSVDAHSPDYIERLKDEKIVCGIIDRIQTYLEQDQRGTPLELCRVYILSIDHLYYKFDKTVLPQKEARRLLEGDDDKPSVTAFKKIELIIQDAGKEGQPPAVVDDADSTSVDMMDKLCKYIYSNDKTDRIRTQAILYHIYHHALHDNWFEARDLMLMSHLQHNIQKADIPLQIIYNRALVQLGLCAFRFGNIKDAHTALLDIQILGRAKELLAQGLLPRQQERTPEQEKMEKRRLLPFHKHINLELLECVYLVSAMLLEIPDVAANEYSIRKKMISRSFYNQLRKNEEQPLVGLPESMREHVVAASKAMRVGNWKTCREFIINEKMNNKVWNLFHEPDKVRDMLVQKIREESLRAYLFTYSHVYDSISLDVLSQMLNLEKAVVHSIISKMTTNEELMVFNHQ